MKVRVLLTPMGDRIKFQVVGRVFCGRSGGELRNSGTYPCDDGLWFSVFGSERERDRFLKRDRRISRVLGLSDLGYDPCDQLSPGRLPPA